MTEGDADERHADGHSHQEEQEQQWPMLAGEAVLLIELCLVGTLVTFIEEVTPLGWHLLPQWPGPAACLGAPRPEIHLSADTLECGLGL